jgi:hypothetical protein
MVVKAQKGNLVDTLQNIRKGALIEQCNELLGELAQAVFIQEGDGEFELKLKLTYNAEGQVKITARPKIEKPIRTVGDAIFYATVDGSLERDDPKQKSMFDDEPAGGGRQRN